MSLNGKICLVTGASRGIGRGIALSLVKDGATVYITGRHLHKGSRGDKLVGGLATTAEELTAAAAKGGQCIPWQCDHGDDASVARLVSGIFAKEGRIDVLVNNAFSGLDYDGDLITVPFWEKPLGQWDQFHRVGLRSHYTCLSLCAKEWVSRKHRALCVNVSSAAGAGYTFDVAYGVGKAGVDRLAADAARELRRHKVAVVSLWPGAVRTEAVQKNREDGQPTANLKHFEVMETVEFSGRGVAALANDPEVMRWSGKVIMTPELAEDYGFTDVDGKLPWGNFLPMLRKAMRKPPPMWVLPSKRTAKL